MSGTLGNSTSCHSCTRTHQRASFVPRTLACRHSRCRVALCSASASRRSLSICTRRRRCAHKVTGKVHAPSIRFNRSDAQSGGCTTLIPQIYVAPQLPTRGSCSTYTYTRTHLHRSQTALQLRLLRLQASFQAAAQHRKGEWQCETAGTEWHVVAPHRHASKRTDALKDHGQPHRQRHLQRSAHRTCCCSCSCSWLARANCCVTSSCCCRAAVGSGGTSGAAALAAGAAAGSAGGAAGRRAGGAGKLLAPRGVASPAAKVELDLARASR